MKPDVVTLHDRFAWQALTGLLARTEQDPPNEWFARSAWDLADAMIAERELRMGMEAKEKPVPSTPTSEDDEAWARRANAIIEAREDGWCALAVDRHDVMRFAIKPTISKAIRALRAKVEGGTR